jgi:hypothetical protein
MKSTPDPCASQRELMSSQKPQALSVPQRGVNLVRVGILDHRNATAQHSDAASDLDGSLVFAPDVPFLASARQQIQTSRIKSRAFAPERDIWCVVNDKQVAAIRTQGLNAGMNFLECEGQDVRP